MTIKNGRALSLRSSCFALAAFLILSAFPIALNDFSLITSAEAAGSFQDSKYAGGLNIPTAMEFSPDGRLFVAQKGGKLMVVKDGVVQSTPFVSLSINSVGERGLLGVTFDPNFESNGFVYLYYTTSTSPIHNRVSRFTADPANPDRALAGSEVVILNLETLGAVNHNGGAIHFGKDGKLYVAVGDNADSAKAQSLGSRLGKMLRINRDGSIPSDNPFFNTVGARREIWALGLRNPFTFAFSPATGSLMYINDVGANTWEEINSGVRGANYGWPTCEGACSNPKFVNPVFSYPHAGSGKAISGGAFYEALQFPGEYKGSYFFGDYVAGFIKRLTPSKQLVNFLPSVASPVDIDIGSDGSLYYLSIRNGEVRKVSYVTGNANPVAVAKANPVSGPTPLGVTFDGSASTDPDGDTLRFSWNFGDGSPSVTGVKPAHTFDTSGKYLVRLTVSDGKGGAGSHTIEISAGNSPIARIIEPEFGTKYKAGDTISFSGSATDKEDGTLPASKFRWNVLFHHNTHTHPFKEFSGVKSGSFTIPRTGESSADVWYRIYLTVTDSSGLSDFVTRSVTPIKSTITLDSNIDGIKVILDGQPRTTPFSFVGVAGFTRTLQAPAEQTLDGVTYEFKSWSDGGAATHSIRTPSSDTVYTATYAKVTGDTTQPSVKITSPADGARVQGPASGVQVRVTGTAFDIGGVDRVQVRLDVGTYATATPGEPGDYSTWSITRSISTQGVHTITAKAIDKAGNISWHRISINVSFI